MSPVFTDDCNTSQIVGQTIKSKPCRKVVAATLIKIFEINTVL